MDRRTCSRTPLTWGGSSTFGWIPPSGLGGDSMMDRWADARKEGRTEKIMLFSHTSKIRWIPPSGLWGDSVTDSRTDYGRTADWTHGKIMLLSHILTMRGSDVASFVEFRPVVRSDSVTDRRTRLTGGRPGARTDGWRRSQYPHRFFFFCFFFKRGDN